MFYLYIIYSEHFDKFYVGSSQNPWNRLEQHNSWKHNTFTSKYRPWELVAVFEAGATRGQSEIAEKFIKKQKSRRLIEKLIDPEFTITGKLSKLVRVPHVRD